MSDEISDVIQEPTKIASNTRRVALLGILTLLTITAAAVLHVNQPEFILDRFAGITDFEYSLFDIGLVMYDTRDPNLFSIEDEEGSDPVSKENEDPAEAAFDIISLPS